MGLNFILKDSSIEFGETKYCNELPQRIGLRNHSSRQFSHRDVFEVLAPVAEATDRTLG